MCYFLLFSVIRMYIVFLDGSSVLFFGFYRTVVIGKVKIPNT